MEQFKKLLKKMGYEEKSGEIRDNIKDLLVNLEENAKKNIVVTRQDMCTIAKNLEKCDHHDLCRLDLILTIEMNKNDAKHHWGSVILGLKWEN